MLLVKKLGYSSLYPVKFIFVVLAGMIFYTAVVNYLYMITAVRYVMVLGYGILFISIGWKYRKIYK